MNFYKVVKDNVIVGACSEYDFRRWQPKHRIIVASGPDDVEVVDYGGTYYHDDWMADSGNIPYEEASVTEITEEEYNSLIDQLDDGTIPDDGSLDEPVVEEPAPEGTEGTVRKTAAQLLQEQIEAIAGQVRTAAGFDGPSETDFVATQNYVKGSVIIVGGGVYKTIRNIEKGAKIVPYLNVVQTNLSEMISEN